MIFFFVKFVSDERAAEGFRSGKLYAERLTSFRERDPDEGSVFFFPERFNLSLPDKEIDIAPDLAGPVKAQFDWMGNLNIISVYAAHVDDDMEIEDREELRRHLQIPGALLRSEETYAIVVTNTPEFIKRVEDAAREKTYGLYRGLVRYVDFGEHQTDLLKEVNPNLPGLQAVMYKRREFRHEREYRFVLITGSIGDGPIVLDVGDISHITACVRAKELNELLEVRLPGEDRAKPLGPR